MYFGSRIVENDLASRAEIGNLIFSALFFHYLTYFNVLVFVCDPGNFLKTYTIIFFLIASSILIPCVNSNLNVPNCPRALT